MGRDSGSSLDRKPLKRFAITRFRPGNIRLKSVARGIRCDNDQNVLFGKRRRRNSACAIAAADLEPRPTSRKFRLFTSCTTSRGGSSPGPDCPSRSCSGATGRWLATLQRDRVTKRLINVVGDRQVPQRSIGDLLLQ